MKTNTGMNDKFVLTKERILSEAAKGPEHEKMLRELFPAVWKDEEVFCKIGCLLADRTSTSLFALIKWNGEVRMLNVFANYFWKTRIPVSQLHDKDASTITRAEFRSIVESGRRNVDNFIVVNDGTNSYGCHKTPKALSEFEKELGEFSQYEKFIFRTPSCEVFTEIAPHRAEENKQPIVVIDLK